MSNTNTEEKVQTKAPEAVEKLVEKPVEKPVEQKSPKEGMKEDTKKVEPSNEEQKLPTKEKVEPPAPPAVEEKEVDQPEEEQKNEVNGDVQGLKDVTAKKVNNVKESDQPTGEKTTV
jgi:hypothetical protein